MKHRYQILFLAAVLGGVYLSVMYINPYGGAGALSEMVLQLSGSRGMFVLGFNYLSLTQFAMRLIPGFVFELYGGIMLYQTFCTASTYVFSRYPHRVRWYMGEAGLLGAASCIFHILLLGTVMLTTACRYEIQVDRTGLALMVYHFLLQSLWVYIMALAVNLLALFFGSGTAYAIVISCQLACIAVLYFADLLVRHSGGSLSYNGFLIWNPLAHQVLGWHDSIVEMAGQVVETSHMRADLNHSLLLFLILGGIITLAGALIIKNHDLLVADAETGVA